MSLGTGTCLAPNRDLLAGLQVLSPDCWLPWVPRAQGHLSSLQNNLKCITAPLVTSSGGVLPCSVTFSVFGFLRLLEYSNMSCILLVCLLVLGVYKSLEPVCWGRSLVSPLTAMWLSTNCLTSLCLSTQIPTKG